MLIYLAVTIFRMHLDAAKVSQVYEMSWHTNQHCETVHEPWTIRHLRICSDVFFLTVIVADADKGFPSAFLKKLRSPSGFRSLFGNLLPVLFISSD